MVREKVKVAREWLMGMMLMDLRSYYVPGAIDRFVVAVAVVGAMRRYRKHLGIVSRIVIVIVAVIANQMVL